jgi:hypothetical protein
VLAEGKYQQKTGDHGQYVEGDADGNGVGGVDVGEQAANDTQDKVTHHGLMGHYPCHHQAGGGDAADHRGAHQMHIEIRHRLARFPVRALVG